MASPQTSSRLQLLQARFQQKQLQEKEQKLLQLYDQQQQRAHQVAQRGSAGSNGSNGSSHGSIVGPPAGKVRQMFDERRQTNVKGIDKSYPLEPLDARSKKHTSGKPVAAAKPAGGRRNAAAAGVTKSRSVTRADVNSNVSSSSRTVVLTQRESFSSTRSTVYRDSKDEEYHELNVGESIRQVNGHARNDHHQQQQHYEINIDEVIDNEAMERNRMLAKFRPIDIEKQRRSFSGDIETEEFPAEMVLRDDKAASPPARKSSPTEAQAERFKNTNTRKSSTTLAAVPQTTTTKKRSEPAIPTGANASTRIADSMPKRADSRASESIQRKSVVPYPSSKSPDIEQRSSRLAAKTPNLKLLTRVGDSSDDAAQYSIENGTSTAARKSSLSAVEYSDSPTDSRNQSFDDEKPVTPAPRTAATSSHSSTSSLGPSRNHQGLRAAAAAKAKSNAGAPAPAHRSSPAKAAANNDDSLTTCKICNRRFTTERITLHEQICSKTSQKKRKQFDAVTHRVKGTELEPFVQKPAKKQGKAAAAAAAKKLSAATEEAAKSNWRRKHEDFINAIRSAKQMQAHLAAGGKLSDLPPPPPSDTSDYVQCPHCSRKFNQGAAERHIPKCENMQHNKPRAQPRSKR